MKRTTQESTINFMYFGHNYPHNFIEEVWKDDELIAHHLRDKFRDMYGSYVTMAFFRWFMELGAGNKVQLLNWIEKNYSWTL